MNDSEPIMKEFVLESPFKNGRVVVKQDEDANSDAILSVEGAGVVWVQIWYGVESGYNAVDRLEAFHRNGGVRSEGDCWLCPQLALDSMRVAGDFLDELIFSSSADVLQELQTPHEIVRAQLEWDLPQTQGEIEDEDSPDTADIAATAIFSPDPCAFVAELSKLCGADLPPPSNPANGSKDSDGAPRNQRRTDV